MNETSVQMSSREPAYRHPMYYLSTLLKYTFIGFLCGALLGAVVAVIWAGPSAFFSHESTWFGTQSAWARVALYYCLKVGSMSGFALGLIVGMVRVLVALLRRG